MGNLGFYQMKSVSCIDERGHGSKPDSDCNSIYKINSNQMYSEGQMN